MRGKGGFVNCRDVAEALPLYFCGEIDAAAKTLLEEHLAGCAACTLRVRQQEELDAHLRDEVLGERVDVAALNLRIRERIAGREVSRQRRLLLMAAGIATLALSVGAAYRNLRPVAPTVICVDAADDHHEEVVDRKPRRWLSSQQEIEALTARNGLPSFIPAAIASGGYHLDRGKVCRLDGTPFLHLVYRNGGNEFSVFLSARDGKPLTGKVRERANGRDVFSGARNGEHMSYFRAGSVTAVVVTNQSEKETLAIARAASQAL
jgi:anti-sigma factor RsiW